MKKTISIMTEEFVNEKTGESVEGITIMIDGVIKDLFDIIKHEKKEYSDNVSIVQDALMKGLEEIKNTIPEQKSNQNEEKQINNISNKNETKTNIACLIKKWYG